jgi:two-component system, chemotaxis family, protein-glutamate methylesterase/glutaminase
MSISRIVLATPSSVDQARLEKQLGQSGAFEIVARTGDLSATYSRVEELLPDAVIFAQSYTLADEYTCMQSLFRAVETRVLLLVPPPPLATQVLADGHIHALMPADEILRRLNAAPRQRNARPAAPPPTAQAPVQMPRMDSSKIILIGASTGGIDALTTLLRHFPTDCPPTAIVQHTGQNFSETLARLLDKNCAAEVVLAKTGLAMQPGRICLAGGIDGHLTLQRKSGLICQVARGPATSGHIPSVDELFLSAVPFAGQVIAALLTGMGRDGANGLLRLRQAGATTIGQDQATSVVYGMPRVAQELGAVQYQMPLDDIGPALMRLCTKDASYQQRMAR